MIRVLKETSEVAQAESWARDRGLAPRAWEYAQEHLQPDKLSAAYLRVYSRLVEERA